MNEDLQRWDEIAKEWVSEIEPKRLFRPILVQNALDELLGRNLNGLNILDAGCGDGVHAEYLVKRGARVIGIDGSSQMIDLAKRRLPNLNFQVADLLEQLPFQDQEFHIVLSVLVFMSMKDISVFLSESNRVLKPGGRLIFVVHHPSFGNTAMSLYKSLFDKLFNKPPKGLIETYYPGHKVARKSERGATKDIPYYHRTFEEYTHLTSQANFLVKRILEPHKLPEDFLQNSPKLEYVTRLPRFAVFETIKQ